MWLCSNVTNMPTVLFVLFRDRNTNMTWLWSCKNALLKKPNKQQAKQNKNEIGTSAGFPHTFLWTKKCTNSNYCKLKTTYYFENDVHTQAQAQGGEGPSGPGPPFNFGLNWGRRVKKNFLGDCPPPLSKGGGAWASPLSQGLDPALQTSGF